LLWCAGAFGFLVPSALAQSEGFFITSSNVAAYQHLPEIENQLYGHAYSNQAVSQRISRVERTLFGASQRGPSELRMSRIEHQMNEKKSQAAVAEQEPILEYLEDKLFQRTFKGMPLPDRIRQLEAQVFGKSFDTYPVSVRIKKLTYAMPLVAKEIRLSSGDTIIASTAQTSKHLNRNGPPQVDMVQLDATGSTIRVMPNGKPLSAGDYAQVIYRENGGSLLRWHTLPIKVYVKPTDANDFVSAQALKNWQTAFSIQAVPNSAQADVIVTWDQATWAQNTTGLMTKPVVQVDDHHNIRTVILISMYPVKNAPANNQLHILTHQLGHAFGLWGHSDDPGDIMYPALKPELNDFPARWAWRSMSVAAKAQPVELVDDAQPSQRDMNTLLRIYDQPSTDLSSYSPY
jgi:predicted Zn-dependent protease